MRTLQSAPLVVLVGLAACRGPLDVANVNNPDRGRLLAKPADVETFIANTYNAVHNALVGGSNDGLEPQLLVSGMESYSGLANYNMGPRAAIPRNLIDNNRGNAGEVGNLRDFTKLSVAARSAADGLKALSKPGFSLGSPGQDARARAFAQFTLGLAMGHLALVYDSGAVIRSTDPPEAINPLADYKTVMAAAIGSLDDAIATVNADNSSFPLPGTWSNGNALTAAAFIQVVRSYRARLRAGVARTPAERAAVDWNAVIADATNGITADLRVNMDPSKGWNVVWVNQHYLFQTWHQMWQVMVGMADTTPVGSAAPAVPGGPGFNDWLALPVANRAPFLVRTPDKRFPAGDTRSAQQTASGCTPTGCAPPTGNLYFRNRDGGLDTQGIPLGVSMYDFYRFQAFRNALNIGPYPVVTLAEMNLLAAEGYIRTGQWVNAAAKIDATRVAKGGLPSVAGITDLTTPVPGGAACVPQVPAPPNFSSAVCGNIFEAMKWEKRMETAFIGYGQWFIDGRGWGDLPAGTALHWPVPWQEMDARVQPFYNMPATGTLPGAALGTYGF